MRALEPTSFSGLRSHVLIGSEWGPAGCTPRVCHVGKMKCCGGRPVLSDGALATSEDSRGTGGSGRRQAPGNAAGTADPGDQGVE